MTTSGSREERRLLGVDVGGTFTDFVYLDHTGDVQIAKRPSTPADPGRAIVDGLNALAWQPTEVVHGSTVATNTLLTRTGSPTALITTTGFRDTLVIGRQARPDLYALHPVRTPPLIPDELRFEVGERIAADGTVVTDLDLDALDSALDTIAETPARTIAVCFLFSFINPVHEQIAADRARARGFAVSASHEVLPQHREYERMSTTAANAYLAPVMTRYLNQLESSLVQRSTSSDGLVRLRIMQSNGGSLSAGSAGRNAVRTVLSGPAGGVAGAFAAAEEAGFPNAITFDMGGTSADVALCPGRLLERTDLVLDDMPIRTPAVDLHTVGAGGGSIAWFDPGGALRVGPQSAGADPGPAAYGRGELPTVTDAHAVLGRLRPEQQLGGSVQLDLDRARAAIETIAGPFQDDVHTAARAIIDVVNANMARALRVISVERGYDPAHFTLVAFGGAGPLHACDLADALGVPQALIPAAPGVLSAAGMLIADITRDAERGLHLTLSPSHSGAIDALGDAFASIAAQARDEIGGDGYHEGVLIEYAADLRYLGQSHELTVPLSRIDDAAGIRDAFHTAHDERFGFATPDTAVEVVTARAKARAAGYRGSLSATAPSTSSAIDHVVPVGWDQEQPTRVISRALVDGRLEGPAIVIQLDTTTLIPPGWYAEPLPGGSLLLRRI